MMRLNEFVRNIIGIINTRKKNSEIFAKFVYAIVECELKKPTKPEVYYRRRRGEQYDFYFNVIRPFSTAEEIREDLLEAVDRSERSDLPSP